MDMTPGIAPVAGLVPSALIAAPAAAAADPISILWQLGAGGALVVFAVWLQDKFSKEKRREVEYERQQTAERTDQLLQSKDSQIAELSARLTEATETVTRISKEQLS